MSIFGWIRGRVADRQTVTTCPIPRGTLLLVHVLVWPFTIAILVSPEKRPTSLYLLPEYLLSEPQPVVWGIGAGRLLLSGLSFAIMAIFGLAVFLALRARRQGRKEGSRGWTIVGAAAALALPAFVPVSSITQAADPLLRGIGIPQWFSLYTIESLISSSFALVICILAIVLSVRAKRLRRLASTTRRWLGWEDPALLVAAILLVVSCVEGWGVLKFPRLMRERWVHLNADLVLKLDGLILEEHRRERGRFPLPGAIVPAGVLLDPLGDSAVHFRDIDPWGRSMIYVSHPDGQEYRLISLGKDGSLQCFTGFGPIERHLPEQPRLPKGIGSMAVYHMDGISRETGAAARSGLADIEWYDPMTCYTDEQLRYQIHGLSIVVAARLSGHYPSREDRQVLPDPPPREPPDGCLWYVAPARDMEQPRAADPESGAGLPAQAPKEHEDGEGAGADGPTGTESPSSGETSNGR